MTSSEILAMKSLMKDFKCDWAICGGWAIDLFLGEVTREHKDVDLFIWRRDQQYAQDYFAKRAWKLQVAFNGKLADWERDDYLELPKHAVWCKHDSHQPNFVELLLNECDEDNYIFRRDMSIRLALKQIFLKTDVGIPYIAPEVALLYKSNNMENIGNQHDFEVCFPKLETTRRCWLMDNLRKLYGDEHKWLKM